MEDTGGNNGSGAGAPLPRVNKDTNATNKAIVAMPIATHGAIACALQGAGAALAVKDAPQL